MDEQLSGGQAGGTTFYVSISREHNGRIKLSTSAHYTAPADENPGDSGYKLVVATATALTVGAAAQASIERIIADAASNEDMIQNFIGVVNECASSIAQRTGGNS